MTEKKTDEKQADKPKELADKDVEQVTGGISAKTSIYERPGSKFE